MSLLRVFSGSCLSLDDHDYSMPRLIARKHELGSGEDLFDESGRPRQPQHRTLNKVFSGSALDLDAQGDSDVDSHGASPAARPADRNDRESFNDFVDNVGRSGNPAQANARTMVLVIGGAGYLASHIIERLLRDGYQVRATVKDMSDRAKVHDLYNMVPEAKHMLFVVETNVFSATSLRTAMAGCRYVMHCGVPQAADGGDVVESHIQAVQALFDAVRSTDIARNRRIERIVLTGSYTNVLGSKASSSGSFTEEEWNDVAKRDSDALSFARVSFEREAVRLAKLGGVELVVILPAILIGPTRTLEVSEAMRTITEFASSSSWIPFTAKIFWNFVDVRDAAAAHCKALSVQGISGQRFIVAHSNLCLADLGRLIRSSHPHLKAPVYTAPTLLTLCFAPWFQTKASFAYLWRTLGVRRALDGSKARAQLGLELTPLQETVSDAVSNLIAEGHLPAGDASAANRGAGVLPRVLVVTVAAGAGLALWLRMRGPR